MSTGGCSTPSSRAGLRTNATPTVRRPAGTWTRTSKSSSAWFAYHSHSAPPMPELPQKLAMQRSASSLSPPPATNVATRTPSTRTSSGCAVLPMPRM